MENISALDEVPQEFRCHVCNNVMIEPVVLGCGHTFCLSCVSRIKKNAQNRHCPDCRLAIPYSSATQCNYIVKQVVVKLKGKCKLCHKEGLIEEVMAHACPEEEIVCDNDGCLEKMRRKNKEEHKSVCQHRKDKCKECGIEMLTKDATQHSEQYCPSGVISCPQGCEKQINRKEFLLHLEKCAKKREECTVDGCYFWGNKEEKARHDIDHANQHVNLLMRSDEKLKEFLIEKKTNVLSPQKEGMESFLWIIKEFKRVVSGLAEDTPRAPLTSPNFDAHGCKWRLVLCIGYKCSLYLQLASTVSFKRVGMRFVIETSDETKDVVFTSSDPITLKEGEMFGADIHLSALETIAEGTRDLKVKVLLETIRYELKD